MSGHWAVGGSHELIHITGGDCHQLGCCACWDCIQEADRAREYATWADTLAPVLSFHPRQGEGTLITGTYAHLDPWGNL